ncbi:MAG: IS630 family transposase, partial [Acinetobacter sp.]
LLYLPPYSPDLNPIEQCWAVLKNQVKQALSQGEELIQAICTTFKYL